MKASWELTETALNGLLAALDPDRDRAGAAYEMLRRKLVRFFEWRQCPNPDELADETVNRVARKFAEGHVLTGNAGDFFFGVARFVLKEHWKINQPLEIDEKTDIPATQNDESVEQTHSCLDRCLNALFAAERDLVLRFYHFDGRAKIDNRQQMADELQIPMNALRIRVHRIRVRLRTCVLKCIEPETDLPFRPVQGEEA